MLTALLLMLNTCRSRRVFALQRTRQRPGRLWWTDLGWNTSTRCFRCHRHTGRTTG